MDKAGLKIILEFSERFWPKKLSEIIGCETVAEFWSVADGKDTDKHILTAYAMGDQAQKLVAKEDQLVPTVVDELDQLFENKASRLLINSKVIDWGNVPFIEGAYSYPSPNSHKQRRMLAKPVGNLFFAGEATNTHGHFATVHGAMESAEDAFHYFSEQCLQ